ncbi:proteophosphoglycan ppg4 [Rhodotorula toruloides]|uniref:Proteophosphoglycan ppg4 n=1 Tax=Rhodotorula toruloides TaxID=5286 RepID=A0A511KCV7_RHOTO|nr:proteophosphoglycan ppg4 [Rhodotorula toruloides]
MAAPPAELPPDLNPSAPRASFDGLPMEIKARVVEHCAEHDEKWAKLRDHLEECVDAEERPPFKGAIKKTDVRRAFQAATETYVPTIGALFRLSRLWSTLAAPHRFKEVRTSQTDTLLFRHHIVQRRGHLFRKVWFDAHDTTILHNFVLILPHFSAVTEADVTDEGFGGYLDEASETDGLSWTALTDASPFGLATVFGRLTYLKTDITRTEDIVRLASAAPNLRALHLSEVAENDGGLTRIFEILPDLRDFVLKEADSELLRTLNNAMFACGGQLFPPIASLEVDVQDDLSEAMRFAQHFAPSLSTLTFNFTSKTRHDYPDDAVYPNLRSLRLEGQVDEIEALMSCMKREQFPAIVELVVCSDQLGVQMAPSMHEAVKNLGLEMQLLERVRIYDPRLCLVDHLLGRRPSQFRSKGSSVRYDLHRPSIKRTLDFLGEWFERAEGPGADGELARLAKVLQQAELERVARAF